MGADGLRAKIERFNSRSREGSDRGWSLSHPLDMPFQFTLP